MTKLTLLLIAAFAFYSVAPDGRYGSTSDSSPRDTTDAWQRFLSGTWHCAGGFPSGRKLSATIAFAPDVGGKWFSYRHADDAPGTYRVSGLWGRQGKDSALLSVQHDNGGGVRVYRSAGWLDNAIIWTRDTAALRVPGATAPPPDRFTYRRVADSTFWFAWELPRPGGTWAVGDSLTCSRRAASSSQ